jgi:hypothetical protein
MSFKGKRGSAEMEMQHGSGMQGENNFTEDMEIQINPELEIMEQIMEERTKEL